MALTVVDVLAPSGRITPDLFPGEGDGGSTTALYQRLAIYVSDALGRGVAAADPDAAEAEWVYYRAFSDKYTSMVALPAEVDQADEGGHRYTPDQRASMKSLADGAKARFEALTRGDTSAPVAAVSHTTRNAFDW